ncbi:hypothetical protein V8E36_002128 [Tilletia maclaganii]
MIDTSPSDVAGPSSASSSSLKIVSRTSSLRIVSRSSGGPAGSNVVDHLWEGGQGASADGGEASTSGSGSTRGSGPGRSGRRGTSLETVSTEDWPGVRRGSRHKLSSGGGGGGISSGSGSGSGKVSMSLSIQSRRRWSPSIWIGPGPRLVHVLHSSSSSAGLIASPSTRQRNLASGSTLPSPSRHVRTPHHYPGQTLSLPTRPQPQHPAVTAAHMTAFGDAYGEAHLPRRHSGVFFQRTRSALPIGRRPDVNTSFGVGGHELGRAGARKAGASSGADASGGGSDDASQTDLQADFWASGPFIALEARNRARTRVRRLVPPLAGLGLGFSGMRTPSGVGNRGLPCRCPMCRRPTWPTLSPVSNWAAAAKVSTPTLPVRAASRPADGAPASRFRSHHSRSAGR